MPPPAPAPSPHEADLREKLLAQLFFMGRSTMAAAVATCAITWILFYVLTGRTAVLVWAALLHGTQAIRWIVIIRAARAFERRGASPPSVPTDARPYLLLLGASAVAWGLASWLVLPPLGPTAGPLSASEMAAVLGIMAFGMLSGSVPGVAPYRVAIMAWLPPATLLLAAGFAWQGGIVGWLLFGCTLLFGVSMVSFALVQHRLLVAGLRSQIEKEALSEQLLLQSEDLARLNQERSRFFASASHDLRQPVHALALFSSALRRDLEGHPAQAIAERVVDATQQVSGLLNAMLDISKIDAGAVQPAFGDVSIDDVFLRLNQIHEERATAAGLSLRFHLVPCRAVTDGELLFRILSNFVDNALKYSAHGGVLVSARRRGHALRLAVWDTGRGIDARHQALVFDEFYQVDNAHRDVTQGLGIGLAIVKRLAALVDGRLGLRSVPGRGSVFWIDLPELPRTLMQVRSAASGAPGAASASGASVASAIAPPAPQLQSRWQSPWESQSQSQLQSPSQSQSQSQSQSPVPASGHVTAVALPVHPSNAKVAPHLRVLLLDDEAAVCEAMRIWLEPHCEVIHVAQRLEQALAIVEREADRLDVLVVDFRLAGPENGLEASRQLRHAARRDVPVILVTGDTDPARVRAAYDSGLVVMFKPVQPDQLVQAMRRAASADPGTLD